MPPLPAARTTASELNDDVLLIIFDWYRLYNTTKEDQGWNLERWWYKPIHVCRRWRHLILASPTHLDLHLVCTYGVPVETMLSHSPPLPLIIYYPAIPDKISTADEESAILALQQRDRMCRIHVTTLTAVLCNLFKSMDCDFPMLERLSLHLSTETRAGLGLPEKLQAPLLRHLTLSHISLPIQSQLLRQAENLITLRLWNVPPSSEFNPAHLVAQLLRMHHLEVLLVHFYKLFPSRDSRALHNRCRSHFLASKYLPSVVEAPIWRGSCHKSTCRTSQRSMLNSSNSSHSTSCCAAHGAARRLQKTHLW
jgi:hypothetical protein